MGLAVLVDGVAREIAVHRHDVGRVEIALFHKLVRASDPDFGPAAAELLAQAQPRRAAAAIFWVGLNCVAIDSAFL